MRVAVIGCGSIGRRHIGNLLALGCEVVASDVDATVVQRDDWPADVEFVKSGVLSELPDAVVIATPWDRHLTVVEECIRRRLPFLVEKPLGSLEQLPRWREIAAMDLPVNQVGYQLRFHPIAAAMQALKPTSGFLEVACDMSEWPGSSYGDPVLEMSHEIDLAHFFGAGDYLSGSRSERHALVTLGGEWIVALRWNERLYNRQWAIESAGGLLESIFVSPSKLGEQMYRAEMEHFLECVRENKPTLCPLADGLRVLEVCAQVEALAKQPA